ncbi:hypothetical protein KC19_VG054400 [Ceratodon purpureus]|uniref:Uncharacterized protein n=1 Tax=Ceratodon purpureus TaxID=3225 RepID=A0A8T0HM83_CERPU|nr:hypothetical protein KC19_VG054400 [Ceratodon purpureus]
MVAIAFALAEELILPDQMKHLAPQSRNHELPWLLVVGEEAHTRMFGGLLPFANSSAATGMPSMSERTDTLAGKAIFSSVHRYLPRRVANGFPSGEVELS